MLSNESLHVSIETTDINDIKSTNGIVGSIVFAKICSIIILAIASCIAGFLPIKLNDAFRRQSNKPTTFDKVMSFFLNFGGGVLICTVFLHLLPEIRKDTGTLGEENIIKEYFFSYPELVMCIGFFMMFFVEETVHSLLLRTETKNPSGFELNGVDNKVFSVSKTDALKNADIVPMDVSMNSDTVTNGEVVIPVLISQLHCSEHKCFKSECAKNYHSCESGHCHGKEVEHTDDPHASHSHIPDLRKPSVNSFLTVLALSTHEIFEGLAVGLEKQTEMVWYLLAAVSCHKVVLAAFIGIQLITADVKKVLAYSYVIGFALTSPIGIFIGLIVTNSSEFNDTMKNVSVVLQAMATGTLLYIVFFEVFKKQFGEYKITGLMRLVASVLGFIFMFCIQQILKDDDDD